jgi:hypothetical protein
MPIQTDEKISGGVIVAILDREPADWSEFRVRGRNLGTAAQSWLGPRDLVYNAQFLSQQEFDEHARGTAAEMWRMSPSALIVDVAFYPSDHALPALSRTFRSSAERIITGTLGGNERRP